MQKRVVGLVLVLVSILVLSSFFVSAFSFSDLWNEFLGKKTVTGNVVSGCTSDQFGEPNAGLCYNYYTRGCSSKMDSVVQAGIDNNSVDSVDIIEQGCFDVSGNVKWGANKVACPSGSVYDVCVKNGNDGNANYVYLGIKLKKVAYFFKCISSAAKNYSLPSAVIVSDSSGSSTLTGYCDGNYYNQVYCVMSGSSDWVFSGNFSAWDKHLCENGCKNGACIQSTPTSAFVNRCSELGESAKSKIEQGRNMAKYNGKAFVTNEGEKAKKDDYVVIYSPQNTDKMRVLRVASIPSNSSTNEKVRFADALTGETFDFITGTLQTASTMIDGSSYYLLTNTNALNDLDRYIVLNWGTGSSYGNQGSESDMLNCTVSQMPGCTDSDGGLNYYVKGSINNDYLHTDTCMEDSRPALSGKELAEYSCVNGVSAQRPYSCENGCYDGQCIYDLGKSVEITAGNENRVIVGNSDKNFKVYLISTSSHSVDPNVAKLDVNGVVVSMGVGESREFSLIPIKDGNKYTLTVHEVFVPSVAGEVGSAVFSIYPAGAEKACANILVKSNIAGNGDAINLATSSQKIYENDPINKARSVLTKVELPNLLADNFIYDTKGVEYDALQTIQLSGTSFVKSENGDMYVSLDSSANGIYSYSFILTKALNISSPNVFEKSVLLILGKQYIIKAGSDANNLYLSPTDGGKVIHLKSNEPVKVGSNEAIVPNTNVSLYASQGSLTKIVISQGAVNSGDRFGVNEGYTDRIFGTVDVEFEGLGCLPEPVQVCSDLINQIKYPTRFVDDYGVEYKLTQNNTYHYDYGYGGAYTSYTAGWNADSYDNLHYYIYYSVDVYDDKNTKAVSTVEGMSNNDLCVEREINSQIVYVCNNDIQGNDYTKYAYVFWANKNVRVLAIVSSSTPIGEEELSKITKIKSEELVKSILNNQFKGTYASFNIDSHSNNLLNKGLSKCKSEISEGKLPYSYSCKMEPAICPEYGSQNRVCVSWVNGKEVSKETRVDCSPGICSGCYMPRWYGYSSRESVCVPYGTRFAKTEKSYSEKEYAGVHGSIGGYLMDILDDRTAILTLFREGHNSTYTLHEGLVVDIQEENQGTIKFKVEDIVYSNKSSESYVELTFLQNFNAYCNYDGIIMQQKSKNYDGSWAKCQNNYECSSNVCSDGECIELKGIANEASSLKTFFVKMICKLTNIGDSEEYNVCIADFGI